MAEVLSPPKPEPARARVSVPSITIPAPPAPLKTGHLNLDVFSPVNENGSFEFDRVLMSGEINKRSRRTKQWKRFYLVLRPNLLSMYKSKSEEKLLKQLYLSDLTAVAILKDPKGRRNHMFGVFSPSRNYHLQANSEAEAREWVDFIKREARIDEQDDEEEIIVGSPVTKPSLYQRLSQSMHIGDDHWNQQRQCSSSPEPIDQTPAAEAQPSSRGRARIPSIREPSSSFHELDYSGADHGSYSDFSDSAPARRSVAVPKPLGAARSANAAAFAGNAAMPAPRPLAVRSASQTSGLNVGADEERVIFHGYLLCLKSKGGVRQWKKLWVVLRAKNLAFYKNEEEYATHLLVPLHTILSAVEIDPVSRSKAHCMQIITEDKSYRFCAPSEEALARWLGALKSQLIKRKEPFKENVPRDGP